jgi:hypothetical protein
MLFQSQNSRLSENTRELRSKMPRILLSEDERVTEL